MQMLSKTKTDNQKQHQGVFKRLSDGYSINNTAVGFNHIFKFSATEIQFQTKLKNIQNKQS